MSTRSAQQGPDALTHEAWVEELQRQQGYQQVVTAGALLANNTLLPPDHMVSQMTAFVPASADQKATITSGHGHAVVHCIPQGQPDPRHAVSFQQRI